MTVEQQIAELRSAVQALAGECSRLAADNVTLHAYKDGELDRNHPIGSLFETDDASFNPATEWGGVWSLYGAGRVTVCVDSTDSDFSTAGGTYGTKTHTLSASEMPAHRHPLMVFYGGAQGGNVAQGNNGEGSGNIATYSDSVVQDTGGGGAHNNVQPSIAVYRWKRTA